MNPKDRFEIISERKGFKIFQKNNLIAEVIINITDRDIQHAEIHSLKQEMYLMSDFDLTITRVPGITRALYCFEQEVAQFVYLNFDTFQCRTWHENVYSFVGSVNSIDVFNVHDNKKIASILTDPHNNHMHVVFEDCVNEELKLIIAVFPCIRFV